jgi:hypothetical protein
MIIKRYILSICVVSLAACFLFVAAFWSHVLARSQSSLRFDLPASSLEIRGSSPEAVIDPDLLVASEIGVAFHRPDCFYAARQTKHKITFKSRAEAEASGRHACSNCFPAQHLAVALDR